MALLTLGAMPKNDPLHKIQSYLKKDYGNFHQNQMQRIQNSGQKNDVTPRTMYMRLARFARESRGVCSESQLVNVFLSNIDKLLLELKCSHYGWNNQAVKIVTFSLQKNHPSFEQENLLDKNIGALEERFKKLASYGQILDLLAPFGDHASSSTPDYYMFRAKCEVMVQQM